MKYHLTSIRSLCSCELAWYPIPSNRIDGYVILPRHACMHVLNVMCRDNRVMQFMGTRHLMLMHDVVLSLYSLVPQQAPMTHMTHAPTWNCYDCGQCARPFVWVSLTTFTYLFQRITWIYKERWDSMWSFLYVLDTKSHEPSSNVNASGCH